MRGRSGVMWGGRIIAVLVFAGTAFYLASVGLDKADKVASALGLLVAVGALIAPYLLPPPEGDHSESSRMQRVTNTVVSGHLTQARNVKDVRVHGARPGSPAQASPPGAGSAPEIRNGQYVNGVWVGGNLTQIDGVDGDITIG